nr:MAG TPA: hypothetical protein [Caudoviricetes sp.]
MSRRSKPYNGYAEKEARRKRQYNAYRRSTAGKIDNILFDLIIASIVLAWNVTVWMFKQVWIFLKTVFSLFVQDVQRIYEKLKKK